MKYFTARIDIKNTGNVQNNIFIISLDDLSAKINYPSYDCTEMFFFTDLLYNISIFP